MGRKDKSDPFQGEDEAELNVSSLIDIAFLLLAFFVVSSTLMKQEADLGMVLPGIDKGEGEGGPVRIDQMLIDILADGSIEVNGEASEPAGSGREVADLTERLARYAFSADIADSDPIVVVQCSDKVREQRFIDVLNACSTAGIKNISLAE